MATEAETTTQWSAVEQKIKTKSEALSASMFRKKVKMLMQQSGLSQQEAEELVREQAEEKAVQNEDDGPQDTLTSMAGRVSNMRSIVENVTALDKAVVEVGGGSGPLANAMAALIFKQVTQPQQPVRAEPKEKDLYDEVEEELDKAARIKQKAKLLREAGLLDDVTPTAPKEDPTQKAILEELKKINESRMSEKEAKQEEFNKRVIALLEQRNEKPVTESTSTNGESAVDTVINEVNTSMDKLDKFRTLMGLPKVSDIVTKHTESTSVITDEVAIKHLESKNYDIKAPAGPQDLKEMEDRMKKQWDEERQKIINETITRERGKMRQEQFIVKTVVGTAKGIITGLTKGTGGINKGLDMVTDAMNAIDDEAGT